MKTPALLPLLRANFTGEGSMPPQTPPGAQGKASLASAPKATAGCRRCRFVRYAPLSVVCARPPAGRALDEDESAQPRVTVAAGRLTSRSPR